MSLLLRSNNRPDDGLRPITFERNYLNRAYGSCLVSFGDTRVLCAVSIDESTPAWLKGSNQGWITAEYAMLPASGIGRVRRETNGQKGRTQEIQRLIGRSLRSCVDLASLGEITITLDCDVIEADGGTRTASICGAWVALNDALKEWHLAGKLPKMPKLTQVAAVSVGMVNGKVLLDLDYHEDSKAEVDMNLVMNSDGAFIEIQGTGERTTFDRGRLDEFLDVGIKGINEILALQLEALSDGR